MKPTDRPWKLYDCIIRDGIDGSGRQIADTYTIGNHEQSNANARYIVKCVNNFDELVECLTIAFDYMCGALSFVQDSSHFVEDRNRIGLLLSRLEQE